ncbi:Chloramphenicol acetyltransferase-like domain-containing protein [Cynara cardunculus var. scolymus]|uniref:Chloramphenicol acetyltransferase-like domain-containing protein n=1 Tax=Cynara cardunculus var. scolymus TaxID=59895 RepID=A0A124SH31_CYNCS|nr:Chloramphenicol acetyltransferase-like domain-containing protein [Cynara cardunculus var. scolymus]
MVSSKEESLIHDIKISTVGPGYVSGQGAVQELTSMDLAMKLHYLRTTYYFRSQALEGLTIINIKETMFYWLNHCYIPCGRFRRSESGRPYIKCNDCGVRFIEARCTITLDEWLELRDDARHKLLVPNQVLGPDLSFCPPLTKFKCGGTSIGVSWAHVLGDAFSAAGFMNLWGQATKRQYPTQPLRMTRSDNMGHNPKSPIKDPLAVKRVGPVGDHWTSSNHSKMETYSFSVSWPELTRLQSKICGDKNHQQMPPFETICTVVWQCVAKAKHGSEVKVVTICKHGSKKIFEGVITNEAQFIKVVKTESSVEESSLMELGLLIMNQGVDVRRNVKEAMETNTELPDFLVYGANLTFVDLYDVPFYELDVRGQTPVYVNCAIDNIGDEGVVLVLPARKNHSDGMTVSITLPTDHISKFRSVLKKEWSL